ncbi:hypothetical protein Val02_89970 [Virgisporangium aliadipatigenens]|uniref:Nucleotidyl transferase AbiEii/AbiGii toxin family protein n=1 Tax=Virgisporangium aliadipatigenens TaxID=741659 RepID=A0A8J3YV40_9ACTN|nr:nucleotidyl transferase AbiEii/AbiGii toxin family protein [Virgisporangium aliadipatigenens]GIJ52111.1 hypothetical protein Val02_89970 [Virgisporangium aliadipatigenens]
MSARRAVLDHVLRLVAASPLGEVLVLRGSMAMLAFAPGAARDPGDLDFVLRPSAAVPIDDGHPYPYVASRSWAQWWPEAAHGALRHEFWGAEEEFETGGMHPKVPPDGLTWVIDDDDLPTAHEDVIELIRRDPVAGTVKLLAERADCDRLGEDDGYAGYAGAAGFRVAVPWEGDGGTGALQIDFAYDERLPRDPVALAVPCLADPPTAVWAASRELSLAWKLQWLHTDQRDREVAQFKDLYDAVLLAESPDAVLDFGLLRRLFGDDPPGAALRPAAVARWRIDGADDPAPLLARLADAIGRLSRGVPP